MLPTITDFDALPLYFEGNSRILKDAGHSNLLICKLKATVFSLQENGPVHVPGIDRMRTQLNDLLCRVLHQGGIKTSTLATKNGLIFIEKHDVPPIEVVVKTAMVGSPKHLYKGIEHTPTRLNDDLTSDHPPYVRFDWRNPLPWEDQCMPEGLAKYFIDTAQATNTALKAFNILQNLFQKHDLHLIDICFFMNAAGDVICAEVSTDNCRLAYRGSDPHIAKVLASKDKNRSLERAECILKLLER